MDCCTCEFCIHNGNNSKVRNAQRGASHGTQQAKENTTSTQNSKSSVIIISKY